MEINTHICRRSDLRWRRVDTTQFVVVVSGWFAHVAVLCRECAVAGIQYASRSLVLEGNFFSGCIGCTLLITYFRNGKS